jgi:ArsR family metal-binding transcriptional regulator
MLIETYDIEVYTPPCDPGTERYAAKAHLTADISDVLPYLNAILRGANYMPEAKALTWKDAGRSIAFHAHEVAVSNIEDRDGAQTELRNVIDMVNRTWEGRADITPSMEVHPRPAPMVIYKLLPHLNCKECGEPTCYYFALKLAASQRSLSNCPQLSIPKYAANLSALQEIIIEA